jgi:hypothetical protein
MYSSPFLESTRRSLATAKANKVKKMLVKEQARATEKMVLPENGLFVVFSFVVVLIEK